MKAGLKKLKDGTIQTKLSRFLFTYRATPQSTTGVSPGELMFGRRLRSPLDNLRPQHDRRMYQEQQQYKNVYDRRAKLQEFHVGDLVYAQNYGPGSTHVQGATERWQKSPETR